jgi:hypothetical protein
MALGSVREPEFSQAIMRGRILADAQVADKLLSRTPA